MMPLSEINRKLGECLVGEEKHVGGDGFAVEVAKLEAFAKRWDDLADEYKSDSMDLEVLGRLLIPPGLEYVSANTNAVIGESIRALVQTMTSHETYCRDQGEKHRGAARKYGVTEAEHSNAIQVLGKNRPQ